LIFEFNPGFVPIGQPALCFGWLVIQRCRGRNGSVVY